MNIIHTHFLPCRVGVEFHFDTLHAITKQKLDKWQHCTAAQRVDCYNIAATKTFQMYLLILFRCTNVFSSSSKFSRAQMDKVISPTTIRPSLMKTENGCASTGGGATGSRGNDRKNLHEMKSNAASNKSTLAPLCTNLRLQALENRTRGSN